MWLKKLMHKWFGWEYVRFYSGGKYKVVRAHKIHDGEYIAKDGKQWLKVELSYYTFWVFKNK